MRKQHVTALILVIAALLGMTAWAHSQQKKTASNVATENSAAHVTTGVQDLAPATLSPPATHPSISRPGAQVFPIHTNITATIFWIGEPMGYGSSEDNALSAWDDEWQKHFGCFDDLNKRNGYFPAGCTPKENPFYLDLPYNDFTDEGERKASALAVVPWAKEKIWGQNESLMKNRWVKITKGSQTCYGQIQDAGPYTYDDAQYVFSSTDARPQNKHANNAGMDVSPALRDCLKFNGLNNDENKVNWQFVNASDVPTGPWKQIVTTSQMNWR